MEYESRRTFYKEHLEELLQYTAVFAVSDDYAVDMLYFLTENRIAVPEKLPVSLVKRGSVGKRESMEMHQKK